MNANRFDELIRGMLNDGQFVQRQLSWVAAAGDYFLKIPKMCADVPMNDVIALGGLDLAYKEFGNLELLSCISHNVVQPIAISDQFACIILGRIYGHNVRDILASKKTVDACGLVEKCVRLLGSLHRSATTELTAGLPRRDYHRDKYLPLDGVPVRDADSLVIDGFEVRNLMLDERGKLWFLDPHDVCVGYPEDDVSRFVVSLLMVRWGSARVFPWTAFSLDRVIDVYEASSGHKLDVRAFFYCMKRNIVMRERFAWQSVAKMSPIERPMAAAYASVFFLQLKYWWCRVRLQDFN